MNDLEQIKCLETGQSDMPQRNTKRDLLAFSRRFVSTGDVCGFAPLSVLCSYETIIIYHLKNRMSKKNYCTIFSYIFMATHLYKVLNVVDFFSELTMWMISVLCLGLVSVFRSIGERGQEVLGQGGRRRGEGAAPAGWFRLHLVYLDRLPSDPPPPHRPPSLPYRYI